MVAWDDEGTGYVVDARSGRRRVRLQGGFGGAPGGVAAASGGGFLLAWSQDAGLSGRPVWEAWDLRTGDIRSTGQFLGSPELGGSITERGTVAVWSGDGAVTSFSTAGGDDLAQRKGVDAAAVSPTGIVAASRVDGRLAFLRARTLRPAGRALPGSPGLMRQLAFSRDGTLLAAQGGDGLVRVIDVAARTQLGEPIEVGVGPDRRTALRADGRELLVSAQDALALWDLRVERWRAEGCRLAGRPLTRAEWSTHLTGAGDYRRTCQRS
jgi:DNA-binding beta-propeller fold protein YncE